MKKFLLNSYILLFLIFFSLMICITETKTSEKKKNLQENCSNQIDPVKMTGMCMKILIENIQPLFCSKKVADQGIDPFDCPNGYFRSSTLCYENCKTGYKNILGMCFANCITGYTDHGLTCYKSATQFTVKSSYVPDSIDNSNSQVPCPRGFYKIGNLCYKNCENVNLINCTKGTCASFKETCVSPIQIIPVTDLSLVAKNISRVLLTGPTDSVKTSIKAVTDKLSILGLNELLLFLKIFLKSHLLDDVLEVSKSTLITNPLQIFDGILSDIAVSNVCGKIWETSINDALNTIEVTHDSTINAFNFLNVKGTKITCEDCINDSEATECANKIILSLSTFSPAELLLIGSQFLHTTCEVEGTIIPRKFISPMTEVIKKINSVKENCVMLYEKSDYLGQTSEVCNSGNLNTIKFKANSMIAGFKASGLFFQNLDNNGKVLRFRPGIMIKKFEEFDTKEIKLFNLISSVLFNGEKCAILSFWKKNRNSVYEEKNNIFCTFDNNLNNCSKQLFVEMQYIKLNFFIDKPFELILFEKANFLGKSYKISIQSHKQNGTLINPYLIGFTIVKSFKINGL